MTIQNIVGIEILKLLRQLCERFDQSRFVIAEIRCDGPGTKIKISGVRLRESKSFCGNHPGACADANHVPRRGRYLEGADWVEFNDTINEVLDESNVSAKVFSRPLELTKPLLIRKGEFRRRIYRSEHRSGIRNASWCPDDEDDSAWCNLCAYLRPWLRNLAELTKPSEFPEDTPGVYAALGYHVEG